MKTTKALFSELVYDFLSERWNEFELPKLSLRELQALAKLLGCPSYGTKETLVVRLLAQRELRSAATAHFPILSFVLTEAALIFRIVCPSSVYIAFLGVIFPMSSSRLT